MTVCPSVFSLKKIISFGNVQGKSFLTPITLFSETATIRFIFNLFCIKSLREPLYEDLDHSLSTQNLRNESRLYFFDYH